MGDVVSLAGFALSSREKNRARRKARQLVAGKQRSCEENGEAPEAKRARVEVDGAEGELSVSSSTVALAVPDAGGAWGGAREWPLECFCDRLCAELFEARWEVRHGAATALREVLARCGSGAGVRADSSVARARAERAAWLEDCCVRLVCVLALDRFGDFVGDAVVAPVRETCAQCVGAAVRHMSASGARSVAVALVALTLRPEWEARHGGLLGLRYLLAVREDLVEALLPEVFPRLEAGLADAVDDVGAVAAAALAPVAPRLVRSMPSCVAPVVMRLWSLLAEQDELAAACNSFMQLLAALLGIPEARDLLP